MEIQVGKHVIGDGHPAFVVAEMAWSHDGSRDKALKIVEAAAAGGAQAINIHVTSLPDYMVPQYGNAELQPGQAGEVYTYLDKINLKDEDWKAVAAQARKSGLLLSVMCNDFRSLEFSEKQLKPDFLMIHPSCVGEKEFVRATAATGKPVMLYVGGLTLGEVEQAIGTAKSAGNGQIILQHGFQSYPTLIRHNNLGFIRTLKQLFGLPVSFADHTDGGDPFALVAPLLGVAMGADIVEKHLTHDRSLKGEDYESALDPADFRTFVSWLRMGEEARGSSTWQPLGEAQLKYRQVVRKRAVSAAAIGRGRALTREQVAFKRSNTGLYPEELERILGRPAAGDIPKDAPLEPDLFS